MTALSSTFSLAISIVAAGISLAAFLFTRRNTESKNYLDQAVLALERAYAALTEDGANVAPPTPNRLNWLTAARHIESYKKLKARIKLRSLQFVCEDHEEYWRHRFYLALAMHRITDIAYYAGTGPAGRQPLNTTSLIVVYGFATWPEGKPDMLDQVDEQEILRRCHPRHGNHALGAYLDQFSRYRDASER
jgi:hypothetical protein